MITLVNNSKATLVHGAIKFAPNTIVELEENIGRIFLLHKGVTEYKDPQVAKEEQKLLKEENEKLKAEIKDLKAEIKKLKKGK